MVPHIKPSLHYGEEPWPWKNTKSFQNTSKGHPMEIQKPFMHGLWFWSVM